MLAALLAGDRPLLRRAMQMRPYSGQRLKYAAHRLLKRCAAKICSKQLKVTAKDEGRMRVPVKRKPDPDTGEIEIRTVTRGYSTALPYQVMTRTEASTSRSRKGEGIACRENERLFGETGSGRTKHKSVLPKLETVAKMADMSYRDPWSESCVEAFVRLLKAHKSGF